MSELKQFRLPDVGEGLTEADIVRWLVKPGDHVVINQIIVEIETAKAVVELPQPVRGRGRRAARTRGHDGRCRHADHLGGREPVGRGRPADQGAAAAAGTRGQDLVPPPPIDRATEPGMHGSPAPKAERQAVLVGYGVKLGTTVRRPRKPRPDQARPAAGPAPADTSSPATENPNSENGATTARRPDPAGSPAVLAKPPVRKLARDQGVDLSVLSGTGPNGSITRDDVMSAATATGPATAAGPAADGPAPARLAPVAAVAREERIAIRGVRKHTAAAVTASAFTAPHVTEFLQIDITETMAATARLRALPEFADVRVSPLLLVAKALLVAAARQPMINSSWDEAAQEIVIRHYVNLGIAAATDRGLIVPNIKDAQALSLPGLARALHDLAETARAGKASPADLGGGTITITNVGVFGVDTGTPILTPGETAILAFGLVKDAPWVHEGQLAVRKVTTLALSFDHRVVDGDAGSAVLRDVGAMLTDPLRMLAWG